MTHKKRAPRAGAQGVLRSALADVRSTTRALATVSRCNHLNGDKSDCRWWNLLALCQRCHLSVQARVDPRRPWIFEHSDWIKP